MWQTQEGNTRGRLDFIWKSFTDPTNMLMFQRNARGRIKHLSAHIGKIMDVAWTVSHRESILSTKEGRVY